MRSNWAAKVMVSILLILCVCVFCVCFVLVFSCFGKFYIVKRRKKFPKGTNMLILAQY